MCKLLIVEDEWMIRTGLKHYFPWQELNVTEIYEAENGYGGLALALEVKPDLIISDIRMPQMNGLEMIEQLRPLLPDTFFIILTGYNDFDYAKQAIRLGNIQDYLLKPLEYEESLKAVQSTLQLIKAKNDERNRRRLLEEEQNRWKQSLLIKQLLDTNGEKVITADMVMLSDQMNVANVTYVPLVITNIAPYGSLPIPNYRWTGEVLQFITNYMKMTHQYSEEYPSAILSYFNQNRLYVILSCKETFNDDHSFAEELRKLNHGQVHKTYMSAGISSTSFIDMSRQLKLAEELLLFRYFLHESYFFKPLQMTMGRTADTSAFRLDGMEKAQLMTSLEHKDSQAIRKLILGFSKQRDHQSMKESVRPWLAFLQELISLILRYAGHHHPASSEIYNEQIIKLSFVEDFQTSEQLFTWLAEWAVQMIVSPNQLEENSSESNDTYVFSEIENFIKQHLDHDLSLQMVAERFFYNPSYLSRLFKTKLNKNYMTYVTELRIEFAQSCLQDPSLLISDVSNMCGYKSYKHFVKTFRNITHMTPTDYRKRIGM